MTHIMSHLYQTSLRGLDVLRNPLLNKGSAFTQEERNLLGLNGLLACHISTLEEQIKRVYLNFSRKKTHLGKYLYLLGLMNRNEILFYQFVIKYISEMLPIIYTPTVGDASVQYSMLYMHQRGLFCSYLLRDRMEEMIANIPQRDVEVIVVTDGERILGLGDQGIGGIAISIGKLALYTIFAGIHPEKTLPVLLDVGTNNPQHLQNELYLGWRHQRIVGAEYDVFIEQFVQALQRRYPRALLQWEDFGKGNAARILERYRTQVLSFNDDIQGTGAVALAALFSAIKVNHSCLIDQKIVILGGGSAGIGIAKMIYQGMREEGLTHKDALERIFIVDVRGLLHTHSEQVDVNQQPFLYPIEALKHWKVDLQGMISLHDVIIHAHPTVLIGVSGQGGAFTKEIISSMAKQSSRPIVLPLSNPTSKSECTPNELIEWTQGKAILATGSPFSPVEYQGKQIAVSQCNNVYIFPGIGLGALAAEAKQITDGMFLKAAKILADFSPALKNAQAPLLPLIEQVREVSREIAMGVAKRAIEEGVARVSLEELERRIDALRWDPSYPRFV
jgi:malate dehydrogenase (oxaloacetate-decarboxylating)